MILDFSWLPSVTAIAGQSLSCLWILQQWHSPIPYRLYLVLQPSCSYDDPPKETAASLCSLCWEEEGEKMGATKQGWIRLCVCGEGVGDGGFAPAPSTSSEKIFSASIMGGAESVYMGETCAQNNKVRGGQRRIDQFKISQTEEMGTDEKDSTSTV